jgi:hypothetical protein
MPLVLPTNALINFDLRTEYETQYKKKFEAAINLNAKPSIIGLPTWLGGTDVANRNKLIRFSEIIYITLSPKLLSSEKITTDEQWYDHLRASRAMIAACLYIQSQIPHPKNSILNSIINNKLGITSTNSLDEADKETCCLAAHDLITYEQVNAAIRKANRENSKPEQLEKLNLAPLSEKEWADFKNFLRIGSQKAATSSNYPITSVTQYVGGATFAYAGATLGIIAGSAASQSTKALATKYQLTAFLGGTLVVLGSAGPAGIALLTPIIAERLIGAFCSISLGHIMATAGAIIGQGVGIGVGIPLDLAYKLIWNACALIHSHHTHPMGGPVTGIQISDGATVILGIVIQITPEGYVPEGCVRTIENIDIKDNELYRNGEIIKEHEMKLSADAFEKLKAQLKSPPVTKALEIEEHEETETTLAL